ncbi:MAG: hypothetical protein IJV41_00660 [Oscillospiraceae bacterium]|nr:hypothetical protein [Oscillospiraceae bacterium]
MTKPLKPGSKYGRILTVEDGWLTCPNCRRNKRLKRIEPTEDAERVGVFCRDCKNEIYITIKQGQCYESRSQ